LVLGINGPGWRKVKGDQIPLIDPRLGPRQVHSGTVHRRA
jgi:hypothetical protein